MSIKRFSALAALVAAPWFPATGFGADIFKCSVRGQTVFQDHPCAGSTGGIPYKSYGTAPDPGLSPPVYHPRPAASGSSQLATLRQELIDATAYSRQLQHLYDADVKMTRLRVDSLPRPEQQRAAEALKEKWQPKLQAASRRERELIDEVRRLCPHGAMLTGQAQQCGR